MRLLVEEMCVIGWECPKTAAKKPPKQGAHARPEPLHSPQTRRGEPVRRTETIKVIPDETRRLFIMDQ